MAVRRVVKVTRDGRIIFDGKGRSVNELLGAVARDGSIGPFELRAHRDALWMHVQWVMAALGESGHKEVHCSVEVAGRGAKGVVKVRLYRGVWEEKLYLMPDEEAKRQPVHLAMEIVPAPRDAGATSPATAEYHLGLGPFLNLEPTTVTQDPEAVARWARSSLGKLDEEQSFGVGTIEASGAVPYRCVALALAALREAGARQLEVGLEALHPWDRSLRVLPCPPHETPILRWFITDHWLMPLVPMNLPVASMCLWDKDDDPDDRLIINLTATGRLIYKRKEVTLAEFATQLEAKARAYDRKMRERGKEGYEEVPDAAGRRWSKLFVLLRADQDAPLQHVRWVMAELADNMYYRLQFGARRTAGRNYTQAEAERRWAAWEIYYPPPTLSRKLRCFLSTVSVEPEASYLDVRVESSPARYVFGARTTRKPTELVKWLREAYQERGERRTVGRILAGPRTPFGEVVGAMNIFALVGIERVDFDGIERASDDVRRALRLPR